MPKPPVQPIQNPFPKTSQPIQGTQAVNKLLAKYNSQQSHDESLRSLFSEEGHSQKEGDCGSKKELLDLSISDFESFVGKGDTRGDSAAEVKEGGPEAPPILNFQMPISLQHYDYTELLEVLEQYKKSMVHLKVPSDGSGLDRTEVALIGEIQSRACSHRVYAESLKELRVIENQLQAEIGIISIELAAEVNELLPIFKAPNENLNSSVFSPQIKLQNKVQITFEDDHCESQVDPSHLLNLLVEHNYLPNFTLNQDLPRQALLTDLKTQNFSRPQTPPFCFYSLPASEQISQFIAIASPNLTFTYDPVLPTNPGHLQLSRLSHLATRDRIKRFLLKRRSEVHCQWLEAEDRKRHQIYKYTSLLRRITSKGNQIDKQYESIVNQLQNNPLTIEVSSSSGVNAKESVLNGEEEGSKKKKKQMMDQQGSNPHNLPYFLVNKDRYEVNKVDRLPKPSIDIYSELKIVSKEGTCFQIRDPITHDSLSKMKRWSLTDLKTFFEKYFIYDRSEFQRIASFLPGKTTKDVVDLFYTLKKRIDLNKYKKEVKSYHLSSNQGILGLSGFISDQAARVLTEHFSQEKISERLPALADFARKRFGAADDSHGKFSPYVTMLSLQDINELTKCGQAQVENSSSSDSEASQREDQGPRRNVFENQQRQLRNVLQQEEIESDGSWNEDRKCKTSAKANQQVLDFDFKWLDSLHSFLETKFSDFKNPLGMPSPPLQEQIQLDKRGLVLTEDEDGKVNYPSKETVLSVQYVSYLKAPPRDMIFHIQRRNQIYTLQRELLQNHGPVKQEAGSGPGTSDLNSSSSPSSSLTEQDEESSSSDGNDLSKEKNRVRKYPNSASKNLQQRQKDQENILSSQSYGGGGEALTSEQHTQQCMNFNDYRELLPLYNEHGKKRLQTVRETQSAPKSIMLKKRIKRRKFKKSTDQLNLNTSSSGITTSNSVTEPGTSDLRQHVSEKDESSEDDEAAQSPVQEKELPRPLKSPKTKVIGKTTPTQKVKKRGRKKKASVILNSEAALQQFIENSPETSTTTPAWSKCEEEKKIVFIPKRVQQHIDDESSDQSGSDYSQERKRPSAKKATPKSIKANKTLVFISHKADRRLVQTQTSEDQKQAGQQHQTSFIWNEEEKQSFIEQLKIHGKKWDLIKQGIPTKTASQCKNFWNNYYRKLGLVALLPPRPKVMMPSGASEVVINDSTCGDCSQQASAQHVESHSQLLEQQECQSSQNQSTSTLIFGIVRMDKRHPVTFVEDSLANKDRKGRDHKLEYQRRKLKRSIQKQDLSVDKDEKEAESSSSHVSTSSKATHENYPAEGTQSVKKKKRTLKLVEKVVSEQQAVKPATGVITIDSQDAHLPELLAHQQRLKLKSRIRKLNLNDSQGKQGKKRRRMKHRDREDDQDYKKPNYMSLKIFRVEKGQRSLRSSKNVTPAKHVSKMVIQVDDPSQLTCSLALNQNIIQDTQDQSLLTLQVATQNQSTQDMAGGSQFNFNQHLVKDNSCKNHQTSQICLMESQNQALPFQAQNLPDFEEETIEFTQL